MSDFVTGLIELVQTLVLVSLAGLLFTSPITIPLVVIAAWAWRTPSRRNVAALLVTGIVWLISWAAAFFLLFSLMLGVSDSGQPFDPLWWVPAIGLAVGGPLAGYWIGQRLRKAAGQTDGGQGGRPDSPSH